MKTPTKTRAPHKVPAVHQGPRPAAVTLHFLGQRSPKPLWIEDGILTKSERYQAIKALELPVTQMAVDETGVKPPLYYIYLKTDEDAYKVYQILRRWPSIYSFRLKIMRYMQENSANFLP